MRDERHVVQRGASVRCHALRVSRFLRRWRPPVRVQRSLGNRNASANHEHGNRAKHQGGREHAPPPISGEPFKARAFVQLVLRPGDVKPVPGVLSP